jgi:Carboxypeptidase regulatory-like domain/TonB-dependent Receptor Plug Domain
MKNRIIGTLSLSLVLSIHCLAQSAGSITGTVKDSQGSAIAGASVTVESAATSVRQTATTNPDGIFISPQLPPGIYVIRVEKSGFKSIEKSNVVLSTADKLNVGDFILEVGTVTEAIQVQADAGQLQIKSESGERSDLITNEQIKNIALNGRNILDLTRTIPGITNVSQTAQSTVTNAGGTFNVNGTRSNMHEITVDGATNLNLGNNTGLLVTLNPDAVSEIKVLTSNYQAEYGKAGGGFVQLTTKSGTNEFHGTGRYFRRHDSMNANSYFNNANLRPRPIYRYNFYGYDIGGPVFLPRFGEGGPAVWDGRKKLFFFWSQEFYRQLIPENARTIRVPTLAERSGDFSNTLDGTGARIFIRDPLLTGNCNATDQTACFRDGGVVNKIPASRFYSNGQAILNLYPAPNVAGRNDFNYSSQRSSEYPRREDILRVDYQISDNTRLSGRFIRNSDEQRFSYGTTTASFNWPLTFTARRNGPGYTFGFTLTHSFSPTLINEFNYSPSKGGVNIAMTDDAGTRTINNITTPLLFPNADPNGTIPNFNYGGIAGQTFPQTIFNGSPFDQTFSIQNITDNLTKVWRSHTIKTGFYFQRASNRRTSFTPVQANINFNNDGTNPSNTGHPFSNALLGIFNTYEQANVRLNNDFVYNNIEGYVQDTWKVSRRLTLDYGLRLSYYQPIYDREEQLGFFNPALFDPAKAVRIYNAACVNNVAPCTSVATRRAVDPALQVPGFVPTLANTLPNSLIGLIVPNSGDLANGIGRAVNGYPKGGFESDTVLWGPRFGFAYDVRGDQKTVVRGGVGITYDRIYTDVIADAIANPPNVLQPTLFYGRLDDIPSLRGSGTLAVPTVWGVDTSGKLPTVYTYSLGVQRNLGWSTVLDVAYVGTLARHLVRQTNLNSLAYGTTFSRGAQDPTRYAGATVPAVQPSLPLVYSQAGLSFTGENALALNYLRPYRGYADINFRSFDASSNYNALQVSVNRRFAERLAFGLAYTWSRTQTTSNAGNEYAHPFNTRAYDYKVADFDRTHMLVVNYVYDVPGVARYLGNNWLARGVFDNWQLSGISQFVTGTPLEVSLTIAGVDAGQRLVGANTGGNLSGQQPRPLPRGDAANGAGDLEIDPNAFGAPPVGFAGPYGRTYLRNPSWNNHDISIFKNFPLGGDNARYLQLRFEFFNVFNHAQFSGINVTSNLAVPNGTDPAGNQQFLTGGLIFNNNVAGTASNYSSVILSNNVRGQRVLDGTRPLGTFFGEFNATREPRVIQLAVKLYF